MTGDLRIVPAGSDSPLLTLLIGIVIVGLFCLPTIRRLIKGLIKQLFRKHNDTTASELTFNERLAVAFGIVQMLVFEALLLYCFCNTQPPLAALEGLILPVGGMLLVQTCGNYAIGYAFATRETTRTWLYTFYLTQAFIGYALVIPVFGALLYPALSTLFITLAAIAYVAIRILFYIRTFGIFNLNNQGYFYFFLYLCTLEIVPILQIWALSARFSTLFC